MSFIVYQIEEFPNQFGRLGVLIYLAFGKKFGKTDSRDLRLCQDLAISELLAQNRPVSALLEA